MKVSRKAGATRRSSVIDSENFAGYNGQENVPNTVNSTKLLITNLHNDITDSDVCELFSEFGIIKEVAVHYNCFGYSLGTAHVVYLEPRDAAEAARRYNGCTLDGQTMTITLEGIPNSLDLAPSLPVKMRLSYGPNHKSSEFRNPLSQLNKAPKRLASGPKNLKSTGAAAGLGVSRGRGRPRGRPAVFGRGKPVGNLPTAAELDLELEEYLSQTKKNGIPNGVTSVKESAMEQGDDDYGVVNEVKFRPAGTKTPARLVRPKKKTPRRTPGTTPSRRTPGKTPSRRTPGKTPSRRTPGKTPSRKTPSTTPGKTPSRKTPSTTPGKTPSTTPGKTPSTTPGKTPSTTPGKTPSTTPGKTSSTTPAKTKAPAPKTSTPTPKTSTPVRKTSTPAKTSAPAPKTSTPGPKTSTPVPKTSTIKSSATPAKTPGKSPGRPKKRSLDTTTDEPTDAMNDLDKTNPPSAVPKSVKKHNPRRSGRFSRMN